MIDADLLRALGASQSAAALYAPIFAEACPVWGIDESREVASFFANVAHETKRLSAFSENLNYSAYGLASTWPRRFSVTGQRGGQPNALALRLHRRPEDIANVVYANRMGNGDENSGDGWRYRGRGGLQCTGRDNYKALSARWGYDVVADPDLLLSPEGVVVSACWFWESHGCNELAQAGEWREVRLVINGGTNGLDEVDELTNIALAALGVS